MYMALINLVRRSGLSETTKTLTKSKNWLRFNEFLIWNVYQPNKSVYWNGSHCSGHCTTLSV